jgi:hypothetical protein
MDGTHPQTHTQTDTEIGEGKTSREKRCHRQQRQRCHISTFQFSTLLQMCVSVSTLQTRLDKIGRSRGSGFSSIRHLRRRREWLISRFQTQIDFNLGRLLLRLLKQEELVQLPLAVN